jgi:hypothetical protein
MHFLMHKTKINGGGGEINFLVMFTLALYKHVFRNKKCLILIFILHFLEFSCLP